MAIVDITSLQRLCYYGSDDLNLTELQKKHVEQACQLIEKMAVKTKLICHTPKIRNGQLQLGIDL